MDNKIVISLVSYLNTKPFLYGLEHSAISERLILQLDIPSVGGKKLLENSVDIGLVPVAVLAKLNDAQIITDYCIGADGPVKSVSVFSEMPIEEAENIFLDYHSLTSVQLLKILLRDHWKITPNLISAHDGYINEIKGKTAGLPFVFAAWITRKPQYSDNIFELNEALKYGVHHIDEVVDTYDSGLLKKSELKDYLQNDIDYNLDSLKRKALDLFIGKIKNAEIVNQ